MFLTKLKITVVPMCNLNVKSFEIIFELSLLSYECSCKAGIHK